jgi:Protein of unknown function (DUF1559)
MAATTSSAFKVQCPSCEAKVTVKDPSLAGKKIDCPKCKYRFVVEMPAGEADDTATNKKAGTDLTAKLKAKGESPNGTAAKSKNKPLPKTEDAANEGGKKKKKKKGGMNPTILIGGGLGLVAIIVLICVFTGVFDSDSGKDGGGGGGGGGGGKDPGPVTPGGNNQGGANNNQGKTKKDGKNQPGPNETAEDFARKDPTNLLPGDAQYVLKINAERFIKTPIGSVFFDESSDSAVAFKKWMGFGSEDVDQFVCAGGIDAPWFFGVFSLKRDVRLDDLKAAMELDPKPKDFARPAPKGKSKSLDRPRELYTIRSNEIIKMLGDYLGAKLPTMGINLTQSNGNRTYALNILNSRTLIIADQPVLERFLQADAKPPLVTQYIPADQNSGGGEGTETNPMNPPAEGEMNPMGRPDGGANSPMPVGGGPPKGMGGGPPKGMGGGITQPTPVGGGPPKGMGGGPPKGMGGSGVPGGGNQNPPRSSTSNPTFLTIDKSLRSMLLQLEDEQGSVLVFASKLSDSHRVLDGLVKQYGAAAGIAINLIPKQTTIGVGVKNMDDTKLSFSAAIEYPDAKDAHDLAQNPIIQKFAQYLATELTQMTRVLVGVGQGNPNEQGPTGPGPMGPGPMGPGIPGPVGPGGPGPKLPGGFGGPGGRNGSFHRESDPSREQTQFASTLPLLGEHLLSAAGLVASDDVFQIAQKPVGGLGPGSGYPMPGIPGSGFPMPGIPGTGGPGLPDPNNPNPTPTSFVSITASDKLLVIDVDIEWKPKIYYEHISPSIRSHVDQIKGEAMMMTGRAHWHQLAATVKRFDETAGPGREKGKLPVGAFPRKTDPSRFDVTYPPDQRVSWMCDLLPFLGYEGLSRRIQRDLPWNDDRNLQAGSAWISEFLNPELPQESWRARVPSLRGRDLGATHFVGLTGIGMESGDFLDTPENAGKLGMFGWNRQTRLADVTDGLSNTIYMIQAPPNVARPWLRGGGATAQGVLPNGSFQPFVAQLKDRRGAYVLMGDGSVRFIKEGIEDPVFQALVTYKAGDKIGDIDQIAPKEKIGAGVVVAPPVVPKVEPKVEAPMPKVEPPVTKVDPKQNPPMVGKSRWNAEWKEEVASTDDLSIKCELPLKRIKLSDHNTTSYEVDLASEGPQGGGTLFNPKKHFRVYAPKTVRESDLEQRAASVLSGLQREMSAPKSNVRDVMAFTINGVRAVRFTRDGVPSCTFLTLRRDVSASAPSDAEPADVDRFFKSIHITEIPREKKIPAVGNAPWQTDFEAFIAEFKKAIEAPNASALVTNFQEKPVRWKLKVKSAPKETSLLIDFDLDSYGIGANMEKSESGIYVISNATDLFFLPNWLKVPAGATVTFEGILTQVGSGQQFKPVMRKIGSFRITNVKLIDPK